ncbi:amphi-Trp domain-containing protein [Desulfovibrio inopinatus]|uniref:amphi-Trp domain-containing protein n=1 Tax=Desulfovibrio inopinatus TaxID=102109 RepID=UPI000421C6E1|nr:amphi-Trp domain-containing protein [Desulfovibrio inopinatus]
MSKGDRFKYESLQDRKNMAEYLRALADGFDSGHIVFTRKDAELIMSPLGLVEFVVEAKNREGRMKLNLKFGWREGTEEEPLTDDSLSIKG